MIPLQADSDRFPILGSTRTGGQKSFNALDRYLLLFRQEEEALSLVEAACLHPSHDDLLPLHPVDILERKPYGFLLHFQRFEGIKGLQNRKTMKPGDLF